MTKLCDLCGREMDFVPPGNYVCRSSPDQHKIAVLEDALGEALGYIVCAVPTKCDTVFVQELSKRTGVKPHD